MNEMTYSEMEAFYSECRIVRKAIRVYGGSFMQAIGDALDLADIYNLQKIRATWNREWLQYLEMGKGM